MSEQQEFDYYYDSYSYFAIHEDMLKDQVRTLAYKNAILKNPTLFQDKVVLDVGCGTGILSMFAATCGARKVYGVEKSSIGEYAKQIIEKNGFSDRIVILQGEMETIELPEKVDVIVSEWMGYCLLYESMLPSVIVARNRFMKPGGTMWPNRAKMYISAIEDQQYYNRKINYWNDIYGFKLEPIRKWALLEPLVEICPEERFATDEYQFIEFDLNICSIEDLSFNAEFTLWPLEDIKMHAFVTWFDVFFEGPENTIELSTSPFKKSTHWCQSIFYLDEPVKMTVNKEIKGNFSMRPNPKNRRDQDFEITFEMNGKTYSQQYKMK